MIETSNDLPFVVASTPMGKVVTVVVIRKRQKMTFQLETGKLVGAESVVPSEPSPNLGMVLQQLTPELAQKFDLLEKSGLLVLQVENNSAADEAGLLPGDIIIEVDQTPVVDLDEFNRKLEGLTGDDTVLFLVDRGGTTIYITLRI